MSEIDIRRSPTDPADHGKPRARRPQWRSAARPEHTPEWGNDGIGNYFYWKAAHRAAWKNPSPGIVAFRIRKAERLGLTYEEYTLEILERGRHLQIEDVERIAQIKQAARRPCGYRSEQPRRPLHSPGAIIHAGYPDQSIAILARYLRDAQ